MKRYRFSPHVYVEYFDDDAILLLADRDVMVTVNRAAAELYELFRKQTGDRLFTRNDCAAFLEKSYDLPERKVPSQVRSLLSFGLKQQLFQKQANS